MPSCSLHRRAAISVAVGLVLWSTQSLCGQTSPRGTGAGVADAGHSIPLTASTDVANKNVTVDAALLPYSVSRRIFGTEIAKHYAIIQLVISNHDAGDAMIVQSVILDYTHWLFSGTFASLSPTLKQPDNLTPQQTSNSPYQVASAESRLVRAELQDAQQWTARNWTVRSAVLIGATAVAYQFPFGQAFAQGSNAFNGVLIPGLQALWPDNVQAQINHISDFGFGTNHVIPKNSSDVVVAFFPLDRFLTPDLQDIFRDAPSAYFNPSEMLIDKKYRVRLLNLLRRAGALTTDVTGETKRKRKPGDDAEDNADATKVSTAILHYEQFRMTHPDLSPAGREATTREMAAACKQTSPAPQDPKTPDVVPTPVVQQDCLLLTLLNGVSLNNIRVVASGIMAVDTSKVPGTLRAVEFDSDTKKPETWAMSTTPQTVTLVGTFLSGAQPAVTATKGGKAIEGAVFKDLAVDAQKSDDNKLVFTYTVPKDIDPETELSFTVVKKAKDGSQTQSAALTWTVQYTPPSPKPAEGEKAKPATGAGAAGQAPSPAGGSAAKTAPTHHAPAAGRGAHGSAAGALRSGAQADKSTKAAKTHPERPQTPPASP